MRRLFLLTISIIAVVLASVAGGRALSSFFSSREEALLGRGAMVSDQIIATGRLEAASERAARIFRGHLLSPKPETLSELREG